MDHFWLLDACRSHWQSVAPRLSLTNSSALGADTLVVASEPKPARRRSLDDMRKLSEEIAAQKRKQR